MGIYNERVPVAQWLRRVTTNHEIEGSSPSGDVCGPVAQWLARLTSNQAVGGSSPSGIVFLATAAVYLVCSALGQRNWIQGARHWFSGKIPRCQRGAPGSIPGWRIFSSCGAVGSASVLCADGPGFEPLQEHFGSRCILW